MDDSSQMAALRPTSRKPSPGHLPQDAERGAVRNARLLGLIEIEPW